MKEKWEKGESNQKEKTRQNRQVTVEVENKVTER